jgi:type II secretory pathway component PulM
VLTPTAARLTVTPRRNPRERRIAVAIGAFAVVSATTSMAMAAQTALPGDTLYPLKRALENASTTIKMDEDAKGASLLAQAAGRLDEVNELTRQSDDPNGQAVADTLHTFADQASTASELMMAAYAEQGQKSDIEELRTFAAKSMTSLNELQSVVPESARAALIEAAQVINQIDAEAVRLCPSCGAGGVTEVPDFDPASVDALLDSLGSALAGPPSPAPGKTSGDDTGTVAGEPRGDQAPQGSGDDGEEDLPVEFPGSVDEPTDEGGTGTNGGGVLSGGDTNVIEALTDRLTGGKDEPKSGQGDLLGELDSAVDGIVGGLLGN